MSRYIKFDCIKTRYRGGFHDDYVVDYDSVMNAQSIDIVRCKECKHWVSDGGAIMFCEHTDVPTDADDFCSYGEREGEE